MFVAILVRRLREGKTYEDFLEVWDPDKGCGFGGRGPITARSLDDEREILTVSFVDLPSREKLPEAKARVADQEALRHDRLDDVIESTDLAIYEQLDELDFSSDESVAAGGSIAAASATDPDELHIEIHSSSDSNAAATGAAVGHVLGRPDTIRQRAQNAATISSAVAAALVIAAVAQLARGETEKWELVTIVLVVLALAGWVLSVVLFVLVVTHGIRNTKEKRNPLGQLLTQVKDWLRGGSDDTHSRNERHAPGASDRENWSYQPLVNLYEEYSNQLRKWLRWAARVSGFALVLTVAAIAAEVIEEVHSPQHERQMVLTQRAASAVARVCEWGPRPPDNDPRINVEVSTRELSKSIVLVEVLESAAEPDTHGCESPTNTVRLPQSAILATSDLPGREP